MNKAYEVVRNFEKAVEDYTGAAYAVAVESCSAALFLACQYRALKIKKPLPEVSIPKYTYPSAASALVHAGFKIKFLNSWDWQESGWYDFKDIGVVDSAKSLFNGMSACYLNKLVCLSFHGKKCLPIGRGGMILCDHEEEYRWFKCARFDGRHERALPGDKLAMPGWNMYLQPEQAARGLEQMLWLKDVNTGKRDEYQDLSQYEFFTKANR